MGRFLRLCAGVIGSTLILAAFSEYIFLNEGPVRALLRAESYAMAMTDTAILLILYLLPGAALFSLLPYMTSWARVVLAGALIGWIIEGALVNAVYEAPPLSFTWTSVSWHSFVDVAFGAVALRLALQSSTGRAVTVALVFGAAWGVWATWPWADLRLTSGEFATLVTFSLILLLSGYWLLGLAVGTVTLPRWTTQGIWGLSLCLGVVQGVASLPFSLGLAGLVALTFWAFAKSPEGSWSTRSTTPTFGRRPFFLGVSGATAFAVYISAEAIDTQIITEDVIALFWLITTIVFLIVLGRCLLHYSSP